MPEITSPTCRPVIATLPRLTDGAALSMKTSDVPSSSRVIVSAESEQATIRPRARNTNFRRMGQLYRTSQDPHVVDQARSTDAHGAREQQIAIEIHRRLERERIDDHEIVDVHAAFFRDDAMHQLLDPRNLANAV